MIEQRETIELEEFATDTALVKAQVRNERESYWELFDAVADPLLITSQSGAVLEVNAAATRRFRIHLPEKGKLGIFEMMPEGETAPVRQGLETLSAENRVVRFAIHMQPRQGIAFEADVTVTRLECDSWPGPRLRWMVREIGGGAQEMLLRRMAELEEATQRLESQIAERRRVEDEVVRRSREVEQRLEKRTTQVQDVTRTQNSMARFLGDVCSRPLKELDGHVRVVSECWSCSLPPEGRRQMQLAMDRAQELRNLLESVAVFARTARQSMERQSVDTAQIVSEVLDELTARITDRCLEIRCGDLLECQADPVLLRLVFHHLLANALKFSRSRETVVIEIQCRHAGKEIIFSIRDNGIGFQRDQFHRLFQPFQRLHRAQGYEGAGVGLATAHQVVVRHGGRIWAEPNAKGGGATFFFALPCPETK